MKAIGRC